MKRLIALFLALLMICTAVIALVSCANPETPDVKQSETVSPVETQAPETGSGFDKSDLPDIGLDGYNFRFMYSQDPIFINQMFPEEIISEPVNDAMYSRNERAAKKYDFRFESSSIPFSVLMAGINAYDDLYDVATVYLPTGVNGMLNSYFLNTDQLEYLDLSKNYWDQNFIKQMSVYDAVYYLCGDISVIDDEKMMVMMYNREMANDFGIENLYDVAYAGNWTFDLMAKYAKQVSADLNQDDKIDQNDRIGFMYASNNILHPQLSACLTRLCEKDKFDLPQLMDDFGQLADVLDAVGGIFDDSVSFDWLEMGTEQIPGIQTLVNSKRVLFQNTNPSQLRRIYRDIETAFGILPLPKLDELQEEYSTSIYIFDVLTIPCTNNHLSQTGFILEALAAGSEELTNAYYHVCLESKFVRDEESFDMIKMMRANVTYDFAAYCDFGGLYTAITNSFMKTKSSEGLISTIESKRSAAEAAIEKFGEFADKLA